ncbi:MULTISPECIES: hypothetical protein [Phyllobacteriaceae]|jgi:hypothetical protein|uniref:Argininosuccinate lyase n=1 Tax=Mesorhizobium hungaricum TaxID=1566387 RepID=A0A1C2DZB4_9HYPH|nr:MULTISPECIES: hypothetical protein [Mesorhizobium]MBN9234555.1 hypothetical protein [Mesorhizobium sp.]MDQ0328967.1 hypothetical protein [Mesorhizobium sp. YL-MeA3-2017]OCX19996.1 hypothetical protein QV13_10435 [Mesorhizobium hungaricum]
MKNWTIAASAAALTLAVMGSAKADDLVFTLKNGTNSVLNAFYTSPVGEDNWEEDVFGQNALAPGGSVTITIKDGRRACKYDMRFEFQGDDLDDLEDTQDLCQMSDYTITE